MRDYLPPMQSLRSFEAAARLSSISKAAAELCVTQGAVSKQIKLLETFLSIALFTRGPSGVSLTAAGRNYFSSVSTALNQLNSSAEQLQNSPIQQQLLLDVIPSMTNIWLIPRIHSFEQRYPHLKVDLITGDGEPDFNLSQADISIRCLLPNNANGHILELAREKLLLVAAPQMLARQPIHVISDILQHRLLKQNTRPQLWDNFLQQQQFQPSQRPAGSKINFGIGFQHFFMSLKAAEEGLGLALIPDFLAASSIAEKRLINPLAISLETDYRYYLFSPSYKVELRKTIEFRQWLQGELKD
ncbi:MAG: hypothetical protein OFPI_20620 [Osedax symbiont Rs2]|nr:MAG: hypothetical protein OFPI_20620 [Osedax symbiont Rs2]